MITGERDAGKLARPVREGAVGKGPEPRAPRRRPTSLGERSEETEPGRPGHRAPGRLSSIGWIMMHRRLARDYETLPVSSEAMIHVASIDNLAKRITD